MRCEVSGYPDTDSTQVTSGQRVQVGPTDHMYAHEWQRHKYTYIFIKNSLRL